MAQYSITKTGNATTIVASGNTEIPVTLNLNIKEVAATADSVILKTDYFPIYIKTSESSFLIGTLYIGVGADPAAAVSKINDYLFPPPPSTNRVNGYASVGTKTTGGEGGRTVTVTTLNDLKAAAASTSPLIIKVASSVSGTGNIPLRSNKTIIGLNGATLNGVGLRVYGTSTTDYVKNIIIQNLKIRNVLATDPRTGGGDNDCIGLKWADHVFVDHCELSADVSHGWDYYDGLIDISKQSDYVTVSWCKLMDSFKACGIGGSSDAGQGRLRCTFHHNLFQNIGERAPSYGYGKGHVYNNYFLNSPSQSGYSIGARFGATVCVEGNYFENIPNPIKTDIDSLQGFVSGNGGNHYRNSGAARITQVSTFKPEYAYSVVDAMTLPSLIRTEAGATLKLS